MFTMPITSRLAANTPKPPILSHILIPILPLGNSCAAEAFQAPSPPMKAPRPFLRNGVYYLKRRVPARYAPIDGRQFVLMSLHTDSATEAQTKATAAWNEMIGAWEARLAGADADADKRLAAAKELAARRGYTYLPAAEVARLPTPELVDRILAVLRKSGEIDPVEAEALLGGAKAPPMRVARILDAYWPISRDKEAGKSMDQVRRWRNPRKKAIDLFLQVNGDMNLDAIATSHLQAVKAHLVDRMVEGDLRPGSVNKDMIHLIHILKEVARSQDIPLRFNTSGLMVKEGAKVTRPPFSDDWIRGKLLAPGALDGMNGEARGILLGMVNTGYRPSEGAQLTRAQIRLDTEIPHISIEPVVAHLKTDHSRRVIPLAGVSLEAFRAFPEGFSRYAGKATLSATVNSYLRENGLVDTPDHSMYGLRHSFEDRMLRAGVDERVRADLMGHMIKRPKYGAGGGLPLLAEVIAKIAF